MPSELRVVQDKRSSKVFWLVLAWMFVGIPLLWGVSQTLVKALALFR